MQQLFWEQQSKGLNCETASSMKWHPMMVRLAIRYESKGPACFDEMRHILRLPCKTILKYYTHVNRECLGIRTQNIDNFFLKVPSHGKGNYVSRPVMITKHNFSKVKQVILQKAINKYKNLKTLKTKIGEHKAIKSNTGILSY